MHTDVNCIFCKIAAKEVPAGIVDENSSVVAFRDLNPATPTHILIVPREHLVSVNDLSNENASLLGDMTLMAQKLAVQEGLSESGYRLVLNTGKNAGQSVFHLHMHLLGGRMMAWPPG